MTMLLFVLSVWVFQLSCVSGQDKIAGRGKWEVIYLESCEDDDLYDTKVSVEKYKCGRSQDCFNATITLSLDIDDTFGVAIDVQKKVDGGAWQDFHKLTDESIVRFLKKYAEEILVAVLTNAGLDPPDFPLLKGVLTIIAFPFDPCQLPAEAAFGEFLAKVYLMKDGAKISCLLVRLNFIKIDDDVECEDA